MCSEQERTVLDATARQGGNVVPGGTHGRSLEVHERLPEALEGGAKEGRRGRGRSGRKGTKSTADESGEERAQEEGIFPVDESKFGIKS